jgi:hypothetical protein
MYRAAGAIDLTRSINVEKFSLASADFSFPRHEKSKPAAGILKPSSLPFE